MTSQQTTSRPMTSQTADIDARPLTAAGFAGEVVGRGDQRYEELRRVFNGMIDRRPALIARCTSARDVSAAVGFARDRRLRGVRLRRRP